MPKKLTELTAATQLDDADQLYLEQGGTSKRLASSLFWLPTNYIGGLLTSNNGTDSDHDIDISPGIARGLADDANLRLAATLTKQIDATWAVGTDQGGLDTGTVANNTLYAIWLIKRSDTGLVDALFSTSFTAPTMPANYDKKRLIAAVRTDGSANILSYVQSGDYFRYLATPVQDVNDTTITSATYETGTLSAPPKCVAHVYGTLLNATATGNQDGYLFMRPIGSPEAAGTSYAWDGERPSTGAVIANLSRGIIYLDASRQMEYAALETSGAATVNIYTIGFDMLTRREP
jgi:hypothetical protein